VPEGDALARIALALQPLVGERLEVEAPHPRAQLLHLAERLDGKRLDAVETQGKNLLLRFEDGLVLRSHLRMNGRWLVRPRSEEPRGRPWLVLRGRNLQALQLNGPVLELTRAQPRLALGPDILADPLPRDEIVRRLRAVPSRAIGEALLDQRLVAGIGNLWKAEALWEARISPWRPVGELADEDLARVVDAAARLMRSSVAGTRGARSVYRRPGRPCRRCGTAIRSFPQGEQARTAYWCPTCQRGEDPAVA
jgi:endonuclease VIII